MRDKNLKFTMETYQQKSEFASFLPGISGAKGIPMWCFYTNRGQAVASFGVQDKEHSIMEFYPAHQAYERTGLMGFRTFLKIDGKYIEAFSDPMTEHKMVIEMNSLTISEETPLYAITVEYETLPMEPLAGLMRKVTITNKQEKECEFEVIDGMAEVIPYGVTTTLMKEMGQTAKAWMQVLDRKNRCPKFNVRASIEDSAEVSEITGTNFALGKENQEHFLPVIVDRKVLFQFDHSLKNAYGFMQFSTDELLAQEQVECNDVPCCFFVGNKKLSKRETYCLEEIYGMSEEPAAYEKMRASFGTPDWFAEKQRTAKQLVLDITERIDTRTGNETFDGYSRQCYLDNLLRGGYPVQLGKNQIFYLYSRKHGDMERDYNFFSMLPEYYSQGNGNFRDVNQNRRCDVQFSPFVGDSIIKTFYNALQINGYNPLVIEKIVFRMEPEDAEKLAETHHLPEEIQTLLKKEFTPGVLYRAIEKSSADEQQTDCAFEAIMNQAKRLDRTKYGEGHWSDHWTYNLDLIESYLSVFPEKEEELLFKDQTYLFAQAEKEILPRRKRYVETQNGIRQYAFLKNNIDTSLSENAYLKDRSGNTVTTSLMAKIVTLLTNKVAALDPYAMGIEMEGGKPGWYDALNGLPGLLGSSMAEAYETQRMALFVQERAEHFSEEIELPEEVVDLQKKLMEAGTKLLQHEEQEEELEFWNAVNDAKELFWEASAKELSGNWHHVSQEELKAFSDLCVNVLNRAMAKARRIGGEVCPTYFYYEVKEYEKTEDGIIPKHFQVHETPDFLEGSVHALKLADENEKQKIYHEVKESRLYDNELKMYKVNASLSEASFELGRACAFTPGWLENESIWLHMEYKYLLELLKAEMYEEFSQDFHHAAIPFLDVETYGRSLFENSSFIASSVNVNQSIRGKGFVARLSGSTAEFLQIWQIMMFGRHPFTISKGNELTLKFEPFIPEYIVGEEKEIRAAFLGQTEVIYELRGISELVPGSYQTEEILLIDQENHVTNVKEIRGEAAKDVRDGKIRKIRVVFAQE